MGRRLKVRSWWAQPCGVRDVLRIALPMAISAGITSIMLFVDRMFLFWHSPAEMAAALPSGMLHWTMICFPLGVAAYVNTFVAQYHGAGRPHRIGAVVWQGVGFGLFMTPLFLASIPLSGYVFQVAGHDHELVAYEVQYFNILALGAGATVMAEAVSAFFSGQGQTRLVMYVNFAAALLNAVIDYVWIFGLLGFPELGIAGAAWGTVVAQWFKFGVFWVLMHRGANATTYQLAAGRRWDWPLLRRLLIYGAPNGLQYLVECAAFTLMTLSMGQYGQTALAATTLAFAINAVAFVPLMGVAMAVGTLVGQQLTGGAPHLAARATWTALSFSVLYTGLFAVAAIVAPGLFIWGNPGDTNPEELAAVRDLAEFLLLFVAAYCLFDAVQVILAGAIKGAGDTWFTLINAVAISFLAVSIGWVGATYFGGELLWWWWIVTGWVLMLGVTNLARFLQGRWRTMLVIEQPSVSDDWDPADAVESFALGE